MKPDKIILYDEVCPMCGLYTECFVRWRWLEREGRQPFREGNQAWHHQVDWARARHEIPLICPEGGPTRYGVDSLLALVGQRHGVLRRIGEWPPVYWLLQRFYRLISYNRRVLAGSRGAAETGPDLHRGWRLALMGPALALTLLAWLRWPAADPAAAGFAWIWAGLLSAGGLTFLRGWDAWGRWTSHALLGSVLWSLVLLLPCGPTRTLAVVVTQTLLVLEARHRFF